MRSLGNRSEIATIPTGTRSSVIDPETLEYDEEQTVVLWWNKEHTHFKVCATEQIAEKMFVHECNIPCTCGERKAECKYCRYSYDQKEFERRREFRVLYN